MIFKYFILLFVTNINFSLGQELDPRMDIYTKKYLSMPDFRYLAVDEGLENKDLKIRVSRSSSWGTNVVEIIYRNNLLSVERFTVGISDPDDSIIAKNYADHSKVLVSSIELVEKLTIGLYDPVLIEFLNKASKLQTPSEKIIIDGSNVFVEWVSASENPLHFYIQGQQLAQVSREIPEIFLSGLLGFKNTFPK